MAKLSPDRSLNWVLISKPVLISEQYLPITDLMNLRLLGKLNEIEPFTL